MTDEGRFSEAWGTMVVQQVQRVCRRVVSIVLTDPDGMLMPAWEPGAHIDLVLPSGRIRQYSLCGDDRDRTTLTVAVLHEPDGRGGSHEVHHSALAGARLRVFGPRNNFSLVPADRYLLVAGGIGITPILAMARALERDRQDWHAVYCGRSGDMAFVDDLRAINPDRVTIRATDVDGRPDLSGLIAGLSSGAAVYCCGPPGLIADVARHCGDRRDLTLHTERFMADPAAPPIDTKGDRPISVELVVTGITIVVPADRTILSAVRGIRPDVPFSCEDGFCGTCETRVLGGVPEHRDDVLSAVEHESNKTMMICVSRARSGHLALEL